MAAIFRKYRGKKRKGSFLQKGTIIIVLTIALGLMGVAYASWNQHFNLFSIISTGGFQLDIVHLDVDRENSDGHESLSFSADPHGIALDEANMNVLTGSNPFSAVLVFSVQNNGTVPAICTGIEIENPAGGVGDPGDLEMEIVEAPPLIDVGETGPIRVRIKKGYCSDFIFNASLVFEQEIN